MIFKNTKAFKNFMANIAQLVIIVLLMPFAAIIIKAVAPDTAGTFITNILDEIPVLNVFTSYFSAFKWTESIQVFSLLEYIVEAVSSSVISMYIVGLFVHIAKTAGEIFGMRGIPAIQTVAGIFLSSFCLKYLGNDFEKSILCTFALIITAFVLSVLVKKNAVKSFFWDAGVGIAMATVTAGTTCAYCAVLVLIIKGYFDSLLYAINVLIWALVPALICLLIDYLLFGKKS